jgi:RNA polymerase sigma-70 factor (ECF subfamily)
MTPADTAPQDRTDMARLAAGDDAALDDLMGRHAEAVLRYLVRLLHDEAEAEDVAQETFVRVYLHRTKFNPRQKFTTWLYSIATNLARDRQRWRTRHPQVALEAENGGVGGELKDVLPAPGLSPAEAAQAGERAELVRHAVAALPEDLRSPLVLAEYEELAQAEIAEILNCSPKAVEMRIYRARNFLRAKLEKLLQPA